jgi:hypothetical protein
MAGIAKGFTAAGARRGKSSGHVPAGKARFQVGPAQILM